MTAEKWTEVKKATESLFSGVKLKIDGYIVDLRLERASAYKNVIAIYIDGKFKGKWLMEDCEERRRFVQKREKCMLTAKKIAALKLSKKAQKEYKEKFTYFYYQTHWTSFSALKKHLIANNDSIELIEII